jgi:gamma-glutamylcyclotransferase (GGCT)/AIG2-like uncharacterized protein YtfP
MLTKLSRSEDSILDLNNKSEFFKQMDSLLDEGVEYVGLINKNGSMEAAIYRIDINMTKEKQEMFSMTLQLDNSMQSDFNDEFGSTIYTITERENSRFVSIPTSAGLLWVKMNKSMDPFLFIKKITGILNFS